MSIAQIKKIKIEELYWAIQMRISDYIIAYV